MEYIEVRWQQCNILLFDIYCWYCFRFVHMVGDVQYPHDERQAPHYGRCFCNLHAHSLCPRWKSVLYTL